MKGYKNLNEKTRRQIRAGYYRQFKEPFLEDYWDQLTTEEAATLAVAGKRSIRRENFISIISTIFLLTAIVGGTWYSIASSSDNNPDANNTLVPTESVERPDNRTPYQKCVDGRDAAQSYGDDASYACNTDGSITTYEELESETYEELNAEQSQSEGGGYINSDGNYIKSPGSDPAGATARCVDGSYSYSQHRQGTCSHHGGVSTWLR